MDDLLKMLMMIGLDNAEKTKGDVDISKVKEQMTQKSIDESAAAIKKMYDSYVEVGFNEVQAFELVKVQLSGMRINR